MIDPHKDFILANLKRIVEIRKARFDRAVALTQNGTVAPASLEAAELDYLQAAIELEREKMD